MDDQMSVGIRGSEDLPHVPSAAKSFPTWGRIVSLLSSILGGRQRSLSQGRRQGTKAHVLHKLSAQRCGEKIGTNREARLRFSYSGLQAKTIFPCLHYLCIN